MKSRKKVFIVIFLIIIVLVNAVSFMHAYKFTHFVSRTVRTQRPEQLSLYKKVQVLLTGISLPKAHNSTNPRDYGYEHKNVTIVGPENLETPVWEVQAKDSKRAVILFHGYSSRKANLLPLADFLLQHNSSVILVDFPGHGDSPYNWTTLGYREAEVVKTVFEYYRKQSTNNILLHGDSLGASSIITAISRHNIVPDGIILEMPYGSLYETTKARFQMMGFPVSFPFAELLVFWGSIICGYNGFQLNPVLFARDVMSPSLVLGGKYDQRAPPQILQEIYTNLQGEKEIIIFQNVGHQNLFKEANDEYQEVLLKFLKNL